MGFLGIVQRLKTESLGGAPKMAEAATTCWVSSRNEEGWSRV